MKPTIFTILILLAFASNAQFKADNVRYQTVYPEDLCKTLQSNKGALLLDVRSPGEYNDTSSSVSLNLGHLKDAVNIDIRQLAQRWKEIEAYKDQPVFIYCSHSQRSRRASRLLADSGFTKVYNVNGGLTAFYDQGIQYNPCESYAIETTVPYTIISSKQLADQLSKGKSFTIIDLRKDSVFKNMAGERAKHEGKFSEAINIPFENFPGDKTISQTKPILLVDEFGDQSPKAAKMLINKGYKNVSILFDGMDGWVDYVTTLPAVANRIPANVKWTKNASYNLLSDEQFINILKAFKDVMIIDVRSKEEFSNASKNNWQNVGQIKGAVNIPAAEIKDSKQLPPSAGTYVIVYGFNGQPEIFESAKFLKDLGYRNVGVLYGGIWRLRWAAHNVKGKEALSDLVVNVPPDNQ
jgi:rhodanese-related sulfurtransferase